MQEEYNEYLTELRDSGETNMFGAAPYLMSEFGLDKREAKTACLEWMRTFKEKDDA